MGLGVRVTTPIAVKQGGTMLDAMGRRNEHEVWGNAADWCDYSGTVDGRHAGITIMCDPQNFRPSWLHARDYGLWWSIRSGSRLSAKARPAKSSSSRANRFGCATAFCCTPGSRRRARFEGGLCRLRPGLIVVAWWAKTFPCVESSINQKTKREIDTC